MFAVAQCVDLLTQRHKERPTNNGWFDFVWSAFNLPARLMHTDWTW